MNMLRKILTAAQQVLTLELPPELIGKRVEVIAFELKEDQSTGLDESRGLKWLYDQFDGLTFDGGGSYRFDRDEATDYE